ncbi:hypothetical protein D1BOALGB6SA_4733 [Olavius sp. associated proteobacterium Delta 1]|nr:hypothetical protein D1BOALGB6SA_4733 [Olavius sp. associated proteobacterium Delta 1]
MNDIAPYRRFRVAEKRTAEYRITNSRISKVGIAALYLNKFIKIDRIPYIDIRHS